MDYLSNRYTDPALTVDLPPRIHTGEKNKMASSASPFLLVVDVSRSFLAVSRSFCAALSRTLLIRLLQHRRREGDYTCLTASVSNHVRGQRASL